MWQRLLFVMLAFSFAFGEIERIKRQPGSGHIGQEHNEYEYHHEATDHHGQYDHHGHHDHNEHDHHNDSDHEHGHHHDCCLRCASSMDSREREILRTELCVNYHDF